MAMKWGQAAGAVALSVMMGNAAWADVTAAQVWQDWQTRLQVMGVTLDGTATPQGDGALQLSDLHLSPSPSPEGATTEVTFGPITLRDTDQGTVAVEMPEIMPVTFIATGAKAAPVEAHLDMLIDGLGCTASGSPGAISYAYAVQTVTLRVTGATVGGKDAGVEKGELVLQSLSGSSTPVKGATGSDGAAPLDAIMQQMQAGPVTYTLAVAEPEGTAHMAVKGDIETLGYTGRMQLPAVTGTQGGAGDIAAMLRAGMGTQGGFTYSGLTSAVKVKDKDTWSQSVSSSASGTLSVGLSEGVLSYGGTAEEVSVAARSSSLPVPVSFDVAHSAFDLALPLLASPEVQPYKLSLTLGDLQVSDAIWGMFDPKALLPRDPATLAVDLEGNLQVLVDLVDPQAETQLGKGQPPVLPHDLSVRDLTLALLGARLDGRGSFTFDVGATDGAADQLPRARGGLDLTLTGADALLGRLVKAGFLPQGQADGMRMMLGLYATPQTDGDVLTSRVEVTPEGHITANGQRLR